MTKGSGGMDVPMGDLVLTQDEVNPVMSARDPRVYFLHYWGTGPADKLATAFKATLGELGNRRPRAARRSSVTPHAIERR